MTAEHHILCGPTQRPLGLNENGLVLDNFPGGNVHLKIEDVSTSLFEKVPDVFLDLIDIASYVYCADQAFERNGKDALGEDWRRQLHFQVPVRHPDLWASSDVLNTLVSTLSFLSDDQYSFEFSYLKKRMSPQGYLGFGKTPYEGHVDGVMLFSGGLDSLGGAIQESIADRRKVLLVNHRSNEKLTPRQETLLRQLRERTGSFTPVFIPVRVNKEKELSHEYTQRARSFLCAALGATIATMVGLNEVRFYENGIVSLNLPPSPQVVGARATRTTHPRVLVGFGNLVSSIGGTPFQFENPFLWKTKTQVVELIAKNGCERLIEHSYSCASTRRSSTEHSHCGECSQCIDRRFAILAAGQEGNDPANAYGIDLLTGSRGEGPSRLMLAGYVDTAIRIREMTDLEFFSAFGEASRALRYIPGGCTSAAARIWDLHRRHTQDVFGVVTKGIATLNDFLLLRKLPEDCLIRLMLDQGSCAIPEPAAASQPTNFVRKDPRGWVIRFNGQKEKHYPDNIGFAYLEFLFQHPGRTFSAIELDFQVRQRRFDDPMRMATAGQIELEQLPVTSRNDSDPVIDSEGINRCEYAINIIEDAIAKRKEVSSPTSLEEIEQLELKRAEILAQLLKAQGPFAKSVQFRSDRDKARHRVGKAIRRALEWFDGHDTALLKHLAPPTLHLGHSVSYKPSEDPAWAMFSAESLTPA